MRPVAISVDEPPVSHDLTQKASYTFPILSDPDARAIRAYGLVHQGAGVKGHDVARPAEFLVDRNGTVRWVYLTEDVRVRARPEALVAATKILR